MRKLFFGLFNYDEKETDGERLFHRILEAFIIAFTALYLLEAAAYIPQLDFVVRPAGLANYIDIHFMFNDYLPFLNAALIILCCLLGFFRVGRYSYMIAVLLFHIQCVARYSQGKISHDSNLTGLCLLSLAVAAICFDNGTIRRKFSFGLMIFFTGFGYFTAAICKLIATGFNWVDGRHLWLWIGERSTDVFSEYGAFDYNILQSIIIENQTIATLMLSFGLLSELAGALFGFRKLRPFIGLALVGMHIGIGWSMNIHFDLYIYILILLAFPWGTWINKWLDKREQPIAWLRNSSWFPV